MDWETIGSATRGRWVIEPGPGSDPPMGASIDTRGIERGQMFVAYKGERADGHTFLGSAQRAGASALIVTDPGAVDDSITIPVLVVDDPTDALTRLASAHREALRGKVVGITGSNGKTTACRLVHSIALRAGSSALPLKSFNNEIGVPLTILNAPVGSGVVVCEIGTSSVGEIGARSALVRPDVSCITSIGRAHLEELGSVDGVALEKSAILDHTRDIGVIPGGVGALERAIGERRPPCALQRITDDRVRVVGSGDRGVRFDLDGETFDAPVPGAHNAMNASCAILVARALGIDDACIRDGLARARLPEMRLDRVEIPTRDGPIVVYNDAYNANPDSTRAALSFFRDLGVPNKVVILGDMLELGGASADEHSSMVGELGDRDGRVVLVGPEYARVSRGFESVASIDDGSIGDLSSTIRAGDHVLLKGSRGIGLERIITALIARSAPEKGGDG